jgi:hypothetical protein
MIHHPFQSFSLQFSNLETCLRSNNSKCLPEEVISNPHLLVVHFIYLSFTYSRYAGSLFAANGFARSAFAAAAILFAGPMFSGLGVHGGVSLLGGLTVLCIFGIYGMYFGEAILRRRSKFTVS